MWGQGIEGSASAIGIRGAQVNHSPQAGPSFLTRRTRSHLGFLSSRGKEREKDPRHDADFRQIEDAGAKRPQPQAHEVGDGTPMH